MTISIQIHVPDSEIGEGQQALAKRLAVLGYAFGHAAVPVLTPYVSHDTASRMTDSDAEKRREAQEAPTWTPPVTAEPPKTRGRPKKSEVVVGVDHAKPGGDMTATVVGTVAEDGKVTVTSIKHEPAPANITAQPENRVDPEAEAQDAADEAAEVAATPAIELTAESLRSIMGEYITAHGFAAAQADGPKLFSDTLGPPPAGAEMWNVSLAAKNPETLAKAIVAWGEAVAAGKRYGVS